MSYKAVVFDLDDTLICEKDYVKSGYRHIAKVMSGKLNRSEDELYQLCIKLFNESPQLVFNRLFDYFNITYCNDEIMTLVKEYRNHYPLIEFYEDVLPVLDHLKEWRIKTGIITDGFANAQRQKLKSIGATNYFDKIIITDELGREYWKPHPKSFEIMKLSLEVEFEEMIYIGDNPNKDFYISTIYPIKTIRINRGDTIHANTEYYKGIEENISIKTLREIIDLI